MNSNDDYRSSENSESLDVEMAGCEDNSEYSDDDNLSEFLMNGDSINLGRDFGEVDEDENNIQEPPATENEEIRSSYLLESDPPTSAALPSDFEFLSIDQTGTEEAQGQPKNPLLIPEILDHLFKFVHNPRTIINCRLVCRTWKTISTPFFRRQRAVTFQSVRQISHCCHRMEPQPRSDTPYSFDLPLHDMSNDDLQELNTFLTKHGGKIIHLKLTLDERKSSPTHLWTILYNCPNIEDLTIYIMAGHVRTQFTPGDGGFTLFELLPPGERGHPDAYRNAEAQLALLRNPIVPQIELEGWCVVPSPPLMGPIAPRLQLRKLSRVRATMIGGHVAAISGFFRAIFSACERSLIFVSCFPSDVDPPSLRLTVCKDLGNILYSCLVESGHSFPKLRDLNFWLKPTTDQLSHLPRFRGLERLKLILGSSVETNSLQKVLSRTAGRLQHLEVDVENPAVVREPFLPVETVSVLKTLQILGHNDEKCLQFFRNSPKAEAVELYGINLKFIVDHLAASRENSPLKSLRIFNSNGVLDIHDVSSRMMHSFHQVSFLEIRNVTNRTLDLIYQTLPSLMELRMEGPFTDEGISGIPQEACDEIEELGTHFTTKYIKLRHFVHIGSLSKLRRLSITSNNMTDISIMFGVTALKNLEDLVISGDLITERIAEVIKKSLNLLTLDISACKNLHDQPLTNQSLQSWWDEIKPEVYRSERYRLVLQRSGISI